MHIAKPGINNGPHDFDVLFVSSDSAAPSPAEIWSGADVKLLDLLPEATGPLSDGELQILATLGDFGIELSQTLSK